MYARILFYSAGAISCCRRLYSENRDGPVCARRRRRYCSLQRVSVGACSSERTFSFLRLRLSGRGISKTLIFLLRSLGAKSFSLDPSPHYCFSPLPCSPPATLPPATPVSGRSDGEPHSGQTGTGVHYSYGPVGRFRPSNTLRQRHASLSTAREHVRPGRPLTN